tara:strand:- start:1727 stop:2140 length:414 start_codon:yes stop_codon:yes gene_type:complete
MSMNLVVLLGKLGKDPELKYTSNSKAFLNLSIATQKYVKGEKKTQWHTVIFWGKNAENVAQYTTKGSDLLINGELSTRVWEDKDGNKRYKTEVVGTSFSFIGNRATSDQKSKPQQSFKDADYKIDTTPSITHDDIPF